MCWPCCCFTVLVVEGLLGGAEFITMNIAQENFAIRQRKPTKDKQKRKSDSSILPKKVLFYTFWKKKQDPVGL